MTGHSSAAPPITGEKIDAVLCEAQGDAREAVRMLLTDLASFTADADRRASYGLVRGRARSARAR